MTAGMPTLAGQDRLPTKSRSRILNFCPTTDFPLLTLTHARRWRPRIRWLEALFRSTSETTRRRSHPPKTHPQLGCFFAFFLPPPLLCDDDGGDVAFNIQPESKQRSVCGVPVAKRKAQQQRGGGQKVNHLQSTNVLARFLLPSFCHGC